MAGKTDGLLTAGVTMSCRTYMNTSIQYPKANFFPLVRERKIPPFQVLQNQTISEITENFI